MRITAEGWDAGRRAYEIMRQKLTDYDYWTIAGCCMAIRLSDGGSDGVLYDSREDAIRHQLHEQQCAYVYFRGLGPSGPNPRDMSIYLQMQREAYQAGLRLIDPDAPQGGPEFLVTANRMDGFMSDLRRELERLTPHE